MADIDANGIRARARVLAALRRTFAARGYLEVPTATLVPSPAMEEHLHAVVAGDGFLRTSPEFALKRVVAAGLGRIYEIGPSYRDREHGNLHRREFTMCEWYRVGAVLADGMDEVESLMRAAAAALGVSLPAFRRVTVRELFLQVVGLDIATASAQDLSPLDTTWEDAFFRRWVNDIEPNLTGALHVTAWPASMAALARVCDDGTWPTALRFETYLHGVELCNAFDELLDPDVLLQRFLASNAARTGAGEAPHPIDHDLIEAVSRMPPTVGVAMGVDRLVAALLGWSDIGRGRVEGRALR